MRIDEFSIRRYGPLKDTGKIKLGDFTLFFGRNEEGKTLTIDAMVKLLLGRNLKGLRNIDRVEENPDGYLIIKSDEGKGIKLPEKGNLTKIADTSPSECRNIFIIRNSDLSIEGESEFYRDVTDRLTGLKSKTILSVKKELHNIGKITPTGEFIDTKPEKIKTRIKSAEELVKKIANLNKKIKAENLDKIEEEISQKREDIVEVENKLNKLDLARKRKKYEEGERALKSIESALKELKALEVYTEENEQVWRDCERDIKTGAEQREKLSLEVDRKEKRFVMEGGELKKKGRDFNLLKERKTKLDEELKPEIKNYTKLEKDLASKKGKDRFYTYTTIILAILLAISLFGYVVRPSSLFITFSIIFAVSAAISTILKFLFAREKAKSARLFEWIKLNSSRFELAGESIEEVLANIEKFNEDYSKKEEELKELEKDVTVLESSIEDIQRKRLPEIADKINNAERKVESLKRKSMVETIKEYTSKLKLKLKYEKSIKEQAGILKSHFGTDTKTLEGNVLHWSKEVGALKEYEGKAKEIEYDEKTVTRLKGKQKSFSIEEEEMRKKMVGLRDELKDVERKVNDILRLPEREEDYLYCNTSVDLDAIKNKLDVFVGRMEEKKNDVIEVINIFEELEREEEEKVSSLFGKDSSVSKYFSEVTGGIYEEVEFLSDEKKIKVHLKDGDILDAEKLSGGAYDQLYLSIRLALGEKLLKGEKGFFIMDDPFIKSDIERLKRQLVILKRIAKLGWQIIYFTAKDEVKDILKRDIESRKVNYTEIHAIFS